MPVSVCFSLLAAVATQAGDAPPDDAPNEIIVTGERVPRSLRETPSSAVVATKADRGTADRVEQILEMVPNVTIGSGGEGPTIRGQDTTGPARDLYAFLGGTRPRTTLIVDGRPVSFNEFVFGIAPLWDVERVEVFRSPQTTTQGKNSIAGAIFVHSRDPEMDPEARVRGILGTYDSMHYSAAFSSPVIDDQVAVRISGDYRYSRPSADIRDRVPGADADRDEYGMIRAKLLATPEALPGARIKLTYSHTQSKMPGSELIRGPDFRKRQDHSGFASIFRTNVDALTANVGYEFSPAVTASAVVSRGYSNVRRFGLLGLGQTRIGVKDWFGETVIRWSPDGPLALVGGVSHARQHLRQHIEPLLFFGEGQFDDSQRGTGLFGEAQIALWPKASLTAGVRYQQDSQRRVGAFGSGNSATDLDFKGTFKAWLPKISLAYDITPSVRAGVLVQRAYNPGGVTLRGDIGQADPYLAETLWDYELFGRASFAEGRLQVSTNLFFYDMRDAQRAQPYVVLGVGFADLFNVPKARSYGAEAQIKWRPEDRFTATAGVGLLRTKFVKTGADYAGFQGNEFQRAPHLTAAASVDWRPVDRLLLSAQAQYSGGYWSDEANSPLRRIDDWTKVDARAEWSAGRFKIFGYVRNVFDSFYLTSLFLANAGTAGDPREWGIGLEAGF